jgi:hypothetical protein
MVDKVKFTLLPNQEPGPKPSQGDGQSFVAKQELTGKESNVKGVVPGMVKELLEGFSNAFQEKLLKEVSSLQDIQPQLDVVSGSSLPNHPHHNKSPKKHEELRQQVEEVNISKSIANFHKEEELLEEVNHSGSLTVFDDNSIHHVLDESPEDEVFDFSLSNFPNKNLDVGFEVLEDIFNFCGQESINPFWEPFMESKLKKINEECVKIDLSQVSVRNFKSTIHNQVMMGCKLFLFQHQVMLMLRSTAWKGLIGHPKDQGKDDLNLRASSFQPEETDVGEN